MWGFIKFFALGLAALLVLVRMAFLSLLGAWGLAVAVLPVVAVLPRQLT
ncbi:MAG: hypothetical protein JSS31_11210 [Proteobacteria bacterium]|nr:hypothetical protein [Pseudomonadota bacterium]MBS0494502.1 hypothetical protein [Pseudomonadota bacterium]